MADSNDSDYSSRSSSPLKRQRSSSARGSTPAKRSRSKASSSLSALSRSRSRSDTPVMVPVAKEDDDDDPYIDEEGEISSNGSAQSGEDSSDKEAEAAGGTDDNDREDGEIDDTDEPSPRAEDEQEQPVPVGQGLDEDESQDDDDDDEGKEDGEIDEDEEMEDFRYPDEAQDDGEGEEEEAEDKAEDTVIVPKARRSTPSSSVSTPTPGIRASSVARNRRRFAASATSAKSSPRPSGSHSAKVPNKSKVPAPIPGSEHTTGVLNEDGDEYIVAEVDPQGEAKLSPDGALLDGREYRMRTFTLPGRGSKIFMMATECAKELQYRDSYLLFNKNRSLYKLIATQGDKEALIDMGLLPYAYRSRQIALVTARSMFRAFGSIAVVDGRRVRDDYWEQKALDDGFTENDFAVEKKPVHIQHSTPNAYTSTSTPSGFQSSSQLDSTPSALESMVFQGLARGDSSSQIVFGTRGAAKLIDIPLDRIVGIFTASSNSTTDPQDEPMKFVATPSKGIRADTTKRAPLPTMVEAAAAALEFNEFVGQKRRARKQMWKAYWTPKPLLKESDTKDGVVQGTRDNKSVDDFDTNKGDRDVNSGVKDSVSVKPFKQDVEVV
ncbi:chromatin remodelling complex Rsc7/Swp82 subunit-domain-containing protein [Lipomyces tetrasporus]